MKGAADVGLLAEHQAQRAKVGELPQLGEPDTEVIAAGGNRGVLQELSNGRGRYPVVLKRQQRRVQPIAAHEAHRVDAKALTQLDVPVQ